MKRSAFLIYILLSISGTGFTQTATRTLLNPYTKVGAYSKLHLDVFSFSANQAALAQTANISGGVFSERKFMLQELSSFSAVAALPTSSGVFGLQVHHFGNTDYSQLQAGLAYGRKLGDRLDIGLQFNYNTTQMNGYGNEAALNVEAGAIFHLTEQFHSGLHVSNPATITLGKGGNEKLPSVYTAGFGYDVSSKFFISAEVEKAEAKTMDVNLALEYIFADRLRIRGGLSSGSAIMFLGLGVQLSNFRIDVTSSLHQQLGISPGLLLLFSKPAKK